PGAARKQRYLGHVRQPRPVAVDHCAAPARRNRSSTRGDRLRIAWKGSALRGVELSQSARDRAFRFSGLPRRPDSRGARSVPFGARIMNRRRRVGVLGTMGNVPYAGMAWMHGQFLRGLADLGHDVFYVETTTAWPYHPLELTTTSDPSYA